MAKKANLLNVKKQLEWINNVIDGIIEETKIARPGGTSVAPLFHSELLKIKFINNAILAKHAKKRTRKDITL